MIDEIYEKTQIISRGTIHKTMSGKYTYVLHLHIMPMDDRLEADGPLFNSAKDAAIALLKVYGQKCDELTGEILK